jgi:hypothetical protein
VAIGGVAAAALPLAARAQQPVPVVGFINARSAEGSAHFGAVFRKGLVAGQNVTVEYHCLDAARHIPLSFDDLKSNIQVSVVGEQGIVLCYGGGQKKSSTVFEVGCTFCCHRRDCQTANRTDACHSAIIPSS